MHLQLNVVVRDDVKVCVRVLTFAICRGIARVDGRVRFEAGPSHRQADDAVFPNLRKHLLDDVHFVPKELVSACVEDFENRIAVLQFAVDVSRTLLKLSNGFVLISRRCYCSLIL